MLGIISGIIARVTGRRVAAKFSDGKQPVLLDFMPAVVNGVEGEPGGVVERSSVTPAPKHHDPRLNRAKVCLETWGLRRGAYIETDDFSYSDN
jgi:hypothetical protein